MPGTTQTCSTVAAGAKHNPKPAGFGTCHSSEPGHFAVTEYASPRIWQPSTCVAGFRSAALQRDARPPEAPGASMYRTYHAGIETAHDVVDHCRQWFRGARRQARQRLFQRARRALAIAG